MNRVRHLLSVRKLAVLLALVLASFSLNAQSEDEDDEDAGTVSVPAATLSIHYDRSGAATVYFVSGVNLSDTTLLRTSLEAALNCPSGALHQPSRSAFASKYLNALPPERRRQIEEVTARSFAQQIQGTCDASMTRTNFVLSTDLDFSGPLSYLMDAGGEKLIVTIYYPETGYSEHTPGGADANKYAWVPRASYSFSAAQWTPAVVHLSFGYQKRDVYRAVITPLVIFLLPILIMFWMRRAAIRRANSDATAAWFGYHRALNYCTTGVMLMWFVAHSVREPLENLIAVVVPPRTTESILAHIALLMVPVWLVYFICLAMSFHIYTQVRGLTWNRTDFYLAQLTSLAVSAIPLTLLIAALETLSVSSRAATCLFIAIYPVALLLTRIRMKVTGTHPEALTSGELRDRVFDLARRAMTELRQVLIVPAGKAQIANAFASGSKHVMFTDYLLERMTKREVTAIAAHEITHIQKRHVMWKMIGLLLLVFSPSLLRAVFDIGVAVATPLTLGTNTGVLTVIRAVQTFPELDLFFYLLGLMLFYAQSRMLENSADAGAIRLTSDPEAMITGLLKLNKLNLMPIHWGRASESLLTHPSTLRRVQRIARLGGLSNERLQQLISQPEQELSEAQSDGGEEGFSSQIPSGDRVLSMQKASGTAMKKLMWLMTLHLAPVLLIAAAIARSGLQGQLRLSAYVIGGVVCLVIYSCAIRWLGCYGRKELQEEFSAKLQAEGFPVADPTSLFVGMSPHGALRHYVSNSYWDCGYVFPSGDRLCYVGDQTRFALRTSQIKAVRLGDGVPSWFPVPRVYVDWWDEAQSRLRTFNLTPLSPSPFWKAKAQAVQLCQELNTWLTSTELATSSCEQLNSLCAPTFGEVTSRSLRELHSLRRATVIALWVCGLAAVGCTVFKITETPYVCFVILLLRIFESWPYWRSKKQQIANAQIPVFGDAEAPRP